MSFEIPWQMFLVAYAWAYLIRNKMIFLMGRFTWLDDMLECPFCLGAQGGTLAWLLYTWGTRSPILIPSLIWWVLAGASGTYIIERVVEYFERYGADR